MFKKPAIYRGLACVCAFVLIMSILASNILEENRTMVDQTLKTQSQRVIATENAQGYTAFLPDEEFLTNGVLDMEKDEAIHIALGTRIQEEGSVLLKNENAALPLSADAKVTLLGIRGYRAINAGRSAGITIAEGLESAGVQVNPNVKEFYMKVKALLSNPGWASNKTYDYKYESGEVAVSRVVDGVKNVESTFEEYHDAAIVVLGRGNGEGADYKPGAEGVKANSGMRNALALSNDEKELINYACDHFDKVVVLISTVSPMELGDLKDDPRIQAMMWIGHPATHGAYGLANLIVGKANPSGMLYDTYAHNSMSSPAMRNMGHYELTNADQITRKDTSSVGTRGTDPGFQHYVIEAEGIYVGYRYYETRYYDCVMGDASAKTKTDDTGIYEDSKEGWNYTEEVCYPFGYGLSYTTFEQSIEKITWDKSAHEQIAHVTVNVKNTGSTAGKTAIQVYGQAPYTDYDRQNGIEKSAVQLLAIEKTAEIAPGQNVSLTVDVDMQNLASYDEWVAKTYIMENSDNYYFAVGNGAHDALNNILAAQGKTVADGMDYDGKAGAAARWTYDTARNGDIDTETFSVSRAGVKVTNQLQYSNWNDYEPGTVTMLSRSDWAGTFPRTYEDMTAPALMLEHYNGHVIPYHTKEDPDSAEALASIKFDQTTSVKFSEMTGAAYDDPRWNELLDAMSLDETILFAIESGRGFAAIDSIGFPGGQYAENGPGTPVWASEEEGAVNAPWAVAKPEKDYILGTFPCFAVVASAFSPEIAAEYGRVLANDAILGNKPMMWLPGSNTHRTPYNGRSEQYYSEDPVLTGIITMEAAIGALNKGGIVTAKHLAFNDQEMHRSGVGTFMTEQRAREIDLRAFQIPFEARKYDTAQKNTGMLGVMTSFSKLGGVECTVNDGLLNGILHGEWNYRGYMVSDLKDDLDLMQQAFKAGTGGYDWRTESEDLDPYKDAENFKYDAELLNGLKKACHQKLYAFANSSLMNSVGSDVQTVWNMTWWRGAYMGGMYGSAALLVLSIGMYIVCLVINKKKERG